MATTTHQGWTLIPQATKPFTTQFNSLISEIDDDVYANEVAVGTAGTNILALGGGANAGKLKKVSDDTWATAAAGTVYYAPDQHGGYFGVIKRQYFSGNTNGASPVVLASSGITKLVSVGGYFTNSADGQIMWLTGYISSGGFGAVVQDSGGNLTLRCGTSFDDAADTYNIYVDYV